MDHDEELPDLNIPDDDELTDLYQSKSARLHSDDYDPFGDRAFDDYLDKREVLRPIVDKEHEVKFYQPQKPQKSNISSKELLSAQTVFNPPTKDTKNGKSESNESPEVEREQKEEEPPMATPVIMTTSSAPISLDKKSRDKSKGKSMGFKTVKVKNSNKYRTGGSPKITNGMSPGIDSMDSFVSMDSVDALDGMADIESYIMQQEEQRGTATLSAANLRSLPSPSLPSMGSVGSVASDSGQFGSEYTPDPEQEYDSSPDLDTSSSFQVVKKEKPKRKKKRNKKRDKKDKKKRDKRRKKKARSAEAVMEPEDCTIRYGQDDGNTYSDMIVKKMKMFSKQEVVKVRTERTNPFEAIDELGGILDDHNNTNPFAKQKSESISSSTNPFMNEQEELNENNPFAQSAKSTNPFFTDGDLP